MARPRLARLVHGTTRRRLCAAAALAASAVLLSPIVAGAFSLELPPATATGWTVIIVNDCSCSNSVSLTTTGSTSTSNLLTLPVGSIPLDAHITPDGKLALVINVGDGTITPIDLSTHSARALDPVPIRGPHSSVTGDSFFAMTPDARTAYVADTADNALIPIDLTRRPFRSLPPVSVDSPAAVVVTADGSTAWVTNFNEGTITPIDLRGGANRRGTPLPSGPNPVEISVSPDGSTAYVDHDTADGTGITAIPLSGGRSTTLAVGSGHNFFTLAPDGNSGYLLDQVRGTMSAVAVAGTSMRTSTTVTVPHGSADTQAFPYAVAVSPDGAQVWVTDGGTTAQNDLASFSGNGTTASVYNATSPLHPVLLRTVSVGTEPRGIAITPALVSPAGPSTIATSLPTPAEAFGSFAATAAGVGLTLGAILFITFPAQLFNLTLQENADVIRDWWRRRVPWAQRRRDDAAAAPSPGRRRASFAIVLLAGALLGGLLDPGFGLSAAGATTYVGIVLAMCIGIAVPAVATGLYHRVRNEATSWTVHALPLGLVVAVVCVLVSRLTQFQPGYLYGVICGVAFGVTLSRRERGRTVGLAAVTTLVVSVLSWLLWVPVNGAATAFNAFGGVVILDNVLAAVFVGGLVGTTITLLPLRFLPGWDLRAWHRGAWFACFFLAMFGVVAILLIPHRDTHPKAPLVTTLVLLVVFAAVSVGVREGFARRRRPPGAARPTTWRARIAALLTPAG